MTRVSELQPDSLFLSFNNNTSYVNIFYHKKKNKNDKKKVLKIDEKKILLNFLLIFDFCFIFYIKEGATKNQKLNKHFLD